MDLQLSALRPLVGFVMVIDVAEQEAFTALVDNQPDVAADPHGPEVWIFRLVQLVQLQAGSRRVELQVESGRLYGFLFVAGEAGQTVSKRVCNSEFHRLRLYPAMVSMEPGSLLTVSF